MTDNSSVAVITGAFGDMGPACARWLGKKHTLLVVDINAAAIEAMA